MSNNRWEQARRFSHIGVSSNSIFNYAQQYQRAFELLYESDDAVDRIALQMLYCLRHYLELALKYNIEHFSEFSRSSSMVGKSGHKLLPFSSSFLQHWVLFKKRFKIDIDDVELIHSLNLLVSEIESIDIAGMSLRYSHDLEANPSFDRLDKIDIHRLHPILHNVRLLLDHTIDVFDDITGLMHGKITKKDLLSQNP